MSPPYLAGAPSEEVRAITWSALERPPRFVQASDWRWLNRNEIDLIVVHTTECREVKGAAGNVAGFFSHPRFAPDGSRLWGSSHLVTDAAEVIECVRPQHEAYGAKGGHANTRGYHIEHCGYAAQTPVEWDDVYSRGELALSARAAACVAAAYGIPVRKLTPLQVANGERGFCGHLDVSRAWNVRGGHVDPGIGFPWGSYIAAVQAAGAARGA